MGSEQVVRRNESKVHDVLWLESALLWATDAGVAACQATGRAPSIPLPKPHTAGANACSLASVTPDVVLVAWPHAVQVVSLTHKRTRLAGTVVLSALQTFSVPYRVHGVAPFGQNIALLADVSPAACRPMPSNLHEQSLAEKEASEDVVAEDEATEEEPDSTEPPSQAPTAQVPPKRSPAKTEVPGAASTPSVAEEDPSATDGVDAAQTADSDTAVPPEAVAESTKQDDTSEAGFDLDSSPQSPLFLDSPPSESLGEAGTSQQEGMSAALRPPKLRLPLEGLRSPNLALQTPAVMGEDDDGKSHLQLRVLTTNGKELTADDLDVEYEGSLPHCNINCNPLAPLDYCTKVLYKICATSPASMACVCKQLSCDAVVAVGMLCTVYQIQSAPAIQPACVRCAGPPGVCMLTCWYPEQYGMLMQEQLPEMPSTPRTPRTPQKDPPTPSPSPAKRPPTPEAAAAAAAASAVAAPDKWWQDSDEPLYLVVTPGTVVVGRPCDADDQVLYLLRQGNYAAAMLVATDAPYVRPETMEECRSAYLKHLLEAGDATGALSVCLLMCLIALCVCGSCLSSCEEILVQHACMLSRLWPDTSENLYILMLGV